MNPVYIVFLLIAVNSVTCRELPKNNQHSQEIRLLSYSGTLSEEIIKSKFSEVHSLEIRLCNITGLSKNILRNFENMESLIIVFSRIQKTDENIFENCCPKLKNIEIRNWVGFKQQYLKGIGTLPLEKLEIMDENIPILKSDMFENTELRELRLVRNNIETIEPTAFSKLNKLEYLLLSENKLKGFPKKALAPLKSLTTLELVSNGLKSLNTDDLPDLPSLKKLIIISNALNHKNFTGVERKAPNLVDIYFIGNSGVQVYRVKSNSVRT